MKDDIVEFIIAIIALLIIIVIFIFCCYFTIKGLIYIITYEPSQVRKYEYIDLNNSSGIAENCTRYRTYPSCRLENGTIVAVKEYKEIWVPNPKVHK